MKAIMIDEFGGPEIMVPREIPDPVAGEGEIVVAVHAASVNPTDWKTRAGLRGDASILPFIPGCDLSGVVTKIGPGVVDFHPGDEVYGVAAQGAQCTYAEAVVIDAGLVAAKPDSLTHVEAAALALVGLTALVSLEDTAKVKSGETILIHGGAGGVGGFAVQCAKHAGATVLATTSARNLDYVEGLGADSAIDYESVDFTQAAPPCDVVFDTVGGAVQERSFSVLKSGGRLIYIARGSDGAPPPPADIDMLRPEVRRDRQHIDRISELVAAGAVWPPEIIEMPLNDAPKAHELSATGHVRGKIVLNMR